MKKFILYSLLPVSLLCWLSPLYAQNQVVARPMGAGEKAVPCEEIVHCDGNPYGGIINDACGECGGDGSACAGCDGIPNSGLVADECGVCGGDGSTCASVCGNAIVEYQEECDDGNTEDGDGCSVKCTLERGTCSSYNLNLCATAPTCTEAGGYWHLGFNSCHETMGTVTVDSAMWQQIDSRDLLTWDEAMSFCRELRLGDYTDWRLPTRDELKSLVVCTNGTTTPLVDFPEHPYACNDGNSTPYDMPTINSQFSCRSRNYWSSSVYDADNAWLVYFGDGNVTRYYRTSRLGYGRCVR